MGECQVLAEAAVAKASKTLLACVRLSRPTFGLPHRHIRRLYVSVVLPRLEYGLSVWFTPVRERPSGKGRCGSVGVARQCDKLQRVAARLIAGGFKTTSTDMLVYHADLLPTTIRLNKAAHSAAVRLATLPKSHPLQPLVACAMRRAPRFHRSPLHELFAAFPDVRGVETIHPTMRSRDASSLFTTHIASSRDKSIAAVEQHHRDGAVIYTDGSGFNGGAGAAAVFVQRSKSSVVRRFYLGSLDAHTVYEGELTGLLLALDIARDLPLAVRHLTILLDNQAAVRAVRVRRCRPGQHLVDAFHNKVIGLLRRRHGLKLNIAWISGHSDVAGNELADIYAKRAAEDDSTANRIKALQQPLPRSAAAIRAAYKHRVTAQRQAWWTTSAAAQKLQRVDKGGTSAHVRRLYEDLPRRQASLLTQLRTGHVGLRGFLARIKVEPSARCEQCGTPETVEHYLIHCPRFNPARHTLRMRLKKPLSLPLLLNSPASIPALLRYIHDTNRFPDYRDDISHLPPLSKHQP